MILTHRVTQSSIFSFFCLFLFLTLEWSEKRAYSQGFCEGKGWCAHLEAWVYACVYVNTVLCVYLWCLVYSAQPPMSSIWCQPKRRAAITNEDRWQGAEATSCEHCNAYVRACLYAVRKYTQHGAIHVLGWAPSSSNMHKYHSLCLFVVIWVWK